VTTPDGGQATFDEAGFQYDYGEEPPPEPDDGWPPPPPTPPVDPLVLDLDGDGIELTSVQQSQVYFDFDGNSFAERTGWVAPVASPGETNIASTRFVSTMARSSPMPN
jgi:hypothetical protein